MSHIFVGDVLRGCHGICTGAKLIMVILAEHANGNSGGVAWPSVTTIAEYSGLSERQVQVHLRELEAAGWLSPVGNTRGGCGKSTRYQLNTVRMRAARLAKGEAHCTLSGTERVKRNAGNGEAERTKRVKPTAPEPEVNLKEPTAASEAIAAANDARTGMIDKAPSTEPEETRQQATSWAQDAAYGLAMCAKLKRQLVMKARD